MRRQSSAARSSNAIELKIPRVAHHRIDAAEAIERRTHDA
jgi:hypothetical protein